MNMYRSLQVVMTMIACMLLIMGMDLTNPREAAAESMIKMEVVAGIGGEYKEADLIPMQVTITNNGEDVSGDIVLAANENDGFTATYYQPIAISKGTTKKVTMLVPGRNLNSTDVVQLMQNNQELARASVVGRRFNQDSFFIGVLAADPDTANFLNGLPKSTFSEQIRLISLKAEDVPSDRLPLSMFDLLLINNFATDRLQLEQIKAIKEWVNQGGLLILSGGSQYDKGASPFQDISPVTVDGVTTVSSMTSLVQGERKPIAFSQPFTISRGQLQSGKVLYQENGVSLFAMRDVYKGKVLYAAYDLIEEPLASWSGNSSLWNEMIQKMRGKSVRFSEIDAMGQFWPLLNASQRIPTLNAPDITWLAVLFGAYALLAGPVLFFLLREKKKRIYIWGMVPALAIAMSLSIYLFGVIQRGTEVLVHNVSFLELDSSGQAEAATSSTVFVPTGGDYEIASPDSELMLPSYNRYRGNDVKLLQNTWVNTSPTQREIRFKDVEYWSIRSIVSQKLIPDAGTILPDLVYQDGKLVGTVTNQTKFPLRDVKLSNGRMIQDLGTINPGQTVKVEVGSDKTIRLNRDSYLYFKSLLPESMKKDPRADMSREYSTLEMLERRNNLSLNKPVRIFGWTEEPIVQVDVKGEETKGYDLTLITAALDVKPSPNGYVFYPHGTFQSVKLSNTGRVEDVGNGYFMDDGEVQLEFDIKQEKTPFTISKVNIFTWSDDNATFNKQVYNWKTKKFEEFGKAFVNNTMQQEQVNTYISPEGKLRLAFSHNYGSQRHLGYPEISVEGWVKKQ